MSELVVAERFLPHYNHFHKTDFRIDYPYLINRKEEEFPDIKFFRLSDMTLQKSVEIKKLADTQQKEQSDSEWRRLIAEVSSVCKESMKQRGVSLSLSIDATEVANRVKRREEVGLLKDNLEELIRGSLIQHSVDLTQKGFEVITSITIDNKYAGILSSTMWGIDTHLDVVQRLESQVDRMHLPSDTVMVFVCNESISEYELNRLDVVVQEHLAAYEEVWIVEDIEGGNSFFFNTATSS